MSKQMKDLVSTFKMGSLNFIIVLKLINLNQLLSTFLRSLALILSFLTTNLFMNHRGDELKTTPLEFFSFVMLTV